MRSLGSLEGEYDLDKAVEERICMVKSLDLFLVQFSFIK